MKLGTRKQCSGFSVQGFRNAGERDVSHKDHRERKEDGGQRTDDHRTPPLHYSITPVFGMTSLKDKITGDAIHRRLLDLRSYPAGEADILVEGSLKDERYRPVYELSGGKKDQGVIHDLVIRLLVGGAPLRILDAEAEMRHVPREQCIETRESIRNIIGIPIRSGFGEQVHKTIGGVKGCAHLTHLLIVMAQEVLHGYWTHKRRKPGVPPRSIEDIDGLPYLINSCTLWRENGPLVNEIQAAIREQRDRE